MIQASDLPLNERGAIYHLNLLPQELGDIVITCGDPGRVEQISKHLDVIDVKRHNREFVTHTGRLGKKTVSVISTGIGMPNIDIVMNELDALANIDLTTRTPNPKARALKIIRLGTTGGLHASCAPGDILISAYALGFDALLQYYRNSTSEEISQFEQAFAAYFKHANLPFFGAKASESLHKHFSSIGQSGITITCSGFYGPQGRFGRLPIAYPQFIEELIDFEYQGLYCQNLEMETAAILGLGQLFGHECLSMSLAINNRTTGQFFDNIPRGVERLITRAFEYIDTL